jgi:ATP-dependent Clp protease adaptor protein ClpS
MKLGMSENDKTKKEAEGGVSVLEGEPAKAEPPKYAVILFNDNYTTMEFVLEVLSRYFKKNHDESMAIMLKVHHEGKGVAGIYSFEIAETKTIQVREYSKKRGFPLMVSFEKIE